ETHPAAGPPPVAAAVHRNPGEPGAPVGGDLAEPLGFVRLQKDVLDHVIGLLRVAQEQATQALKAPVVGGDQQIRPGCGLHVPLTSVPSPLISPDERNRRCVDTPGTVNRGWRVFVTRGGACGPSSRQQVASIWCPKGG